MRNQFSKCSGRATLWMAGLLVIGGGISSCSDDYTLDDERPSWLKKSIYQTLLEEGTYSTYLKLLSDSDVNVEGERSLVDVLNKTGSKTVFAATDSTWNVFFKNNATKLAEAKAAGQTVYDPWLNATSYEALTKSQKNLLVHTSMLANAIVTENLSTDEGADGVRGSWMRRATDVQISDTITLIPEEQIPYTLSSADLQLRATAATDHDYWARFHEQSGGEGKVYLVCDDDASMMPYFTNEYLKAKNITDEDYHIFIGGGTRNTRDITLYDSKVTDQDITCLNGYIDLCEKPVHPVGNLAEIIRTNGETNIFSHMLDRYSVPLFDATITKDYQNLYPEFTDSIFVKRYFAQLSTGCAQLETADQYDDSYSFVDHNPNCLLKFDPGWNSFKATSDDNKEHTDMATMFVPNDEALKQYFTEDIGDRILAAHAKGWSEMTTSEKKALNGKDLYLYLDQIPFTITTQLINEIMFPYFYDAVPSKMTTLRNSAQNQMFYEDDGDTKLVSEGGHIYKTMLANNGLLYIMDKVYTPADYNSVASPAAIDNDKVIMNWAIYNGNDGKNDLMGLNYYAYLKAMKSVYTVFMPNDSAMLYYYDVPSFCGKTPRVMQMIYNPSATSSVAPIYTKTGSDKKTGIFFNFDTDQGKIGKVLATTQTSNSSDILNKLREILETHTVVHDVDTKTGNPILTDVNQYYLTKKGSAVKVTRSADGTTLEKVQGGFQLYNELRGVYDDPTTDVPTIGVDHVAITRKTGAKNGITFQTNAIIEQSPLSVYGLLSQYPHTYKAYDRDATDETDDNPWGRFFILCNDVEDGNGMLGGDNLTLEKLLEGCKLIDTDSKQYKGKPTAVTTAVNKYRTFAPSSGTGYKYGLDFDVNFFNNFNYTIMVPANSAIQEAVDQKGLPTWQSIREYFVKHATEDESGDWVIEDETERVKVQAMITYLVNFVRNHFIDNSVFADRGAMSEVEYNTNSFDNTLNKFCTVTMKREGSANGDLEVKSAADGNYISVDGDDNYRNIMTQDIECSKEIYQKTGTVLTGMTVDANSYAVVHRIPTVLNHKALVNGRYDSEWATAEAARNYVKRFAIK